MEKGVKIKNIRQQYRKYLLAFLNTCGQCT